nr:MAG: hypothetical protein [Microviridae sp.]
MDNTEQQSNIQDALNERDNSNSEYKIAQIGDSIFRTAENKNRILFVMGDNIIETIEKTEKYWYWKKLNTKRTLNKMNTKLTIPIIAAMIEVVLIEMNKKNKNK